LKEIILFLLFIVITNLNAQDQHAKNMKKVVILCSGQRIVDVSNLFEGIANAEMDTWHPYYHVAMVNTTASFGEKDEQKLSLQLGKAKVYVDVAKNDAPNNKGLLVLEAMASNAWLDFYESIYGMTLSGKNVQLYQTVAEVALDNPRAVFGNTYSLMGAARYFGKNTAPYCRDIEKSLELFANFKRDSDFHLNRNQDCAEQIAMDCKS
jgi:hypothetical protein